jgi:hypothetical protein|tara:strand:- start:10321 stop:10560 length:240 start_codon:yes stop_codon:yes gene_type:complete
MKIDSDIKDFVKTNQGMLRRILEEVKQDYLNNVVDEPDPQKKEVLSLFVKELRMIEKMINNLASLKEKKEKRDEEYTGV